MGNILSMVKGGQADAKVRTDDQMVRPTEVPKYLRDTEFYRSLDTEEDEAFYVPVGHMKANMNVENVEDACALLNTARFWGLENNAIRASIVQFASAQPFAVIQPAFANFGNEFLFIKLLLQFKNTKNHPNQRMEAAMELGVIELVRQQDEGWNNLHTSDKAIYRAASLGYLDCLQYALQRVQAMSGGHRNAALSKKACLAAAEYGQLHCLQYLHEFGVILDVQIGIGAAAGGSLSCLQYYHEHGGDCDFQILSTAALHGRLTCLQYAHEHRCSANSDERTHNNHLIHTRHAAAPLVEQVAQRKHWSCVQYLIQQSFPLTRKLTAILVRHRQDRLLQLAIQCGGSLATEVGIQFARAGRLERLKFAFEYGCKPSVRILCAAARQGHLNCLQYAHEQGCAWSKEVCVGAARGGHLECLQYAREHGCPWDGQVHIVATKMRPKRVLEYAQQQNCPYHCD